VSGVRHGSPPLSSKRQVARFSGAEDIGFQSEANTGSGTLIVSGMEPMMDLSASCRCRRVDCERLGRRAPVLHPEVVVNGFLMVLLQFSQSNRSVSSL
jgi:hypothetical protein